MSAITIRIPTPLARHSSHAPTAITDVTTITNAAGTTTYSWDSLPDYIMSDSITHEMIQHCSDFLVDMDWAAMESKLDMAVGCRYLLHKEIIPYKNFKIIQEYLTVYYGKKRWNRMIVTYICSMEYSPYPFHMDYYHAQV